MMKKTDTVAHRLFVAAFCGSSTRTPRSAEYKSGAYAVLRYRSGEHKVMHSCPYPHGTAQADAWFAGCDEGHHLWRDAQGARA